jgi:DNA-binding Lrp family transcriptional regulator
MRMAKLDLIDRRLLNLLQGAFPLVERPFAALAAELGVSENEVLGRARRLRDAGVIRHLSAIFDVYRVGYRSALVACVVPPERLDDAAAVISAHPGVSHNYSREHRFNLWFVMAVPGDEDFDAAVDALVRRAGVETYHVLPAKRLFKIAVEYDMVGGAAAAQKRDNGHRKSPRRPLTEQEKQIVRLLQEDLLITSRPFAPAARALGMSEPELMSRLRSLQDEGIMRRFAAVLRHQEAGFESNGMVCWRPPEDRIEATGEALAADPRVSHCYWRPTFHDWPYPVFSMIHAQKREEVERIARELSDKIGVPEYAILFSVREYKKERVKYFVEAPANAR